MKFRFRKSKKIIPGVKLNVTTKGVSANVGPKGANLGIGKRGIFGNVSVPKTGISGRQKLSGCSGIIALTGLLLIGLIAFLGS